MVWVIGIIKFLCAAIAMFCTCAFILSCITSVINPNFKVEGNKVTDGSDNVRYTLALILSVAWGIVIAL